ncbi:unnamed protein product [Adineta ricciae]|uniref:Uncharacterized protein n=1 Tax=Adineta ricciae TaxID=249248 RepID=A0A816HPJ1_ADIRI|nr:unnamed protein product [Adineta ricciae]
MYVITTLLGLFGGLTKGLYFFVFYMDLAVRTIVKRRKNEEKQLSISVPSMSDIPPINQDEIDVEADTTINGDSVDKQRGNVSKQRHQHRVLIICLISLSLAAIVILSIIVAVNRDKKQHKSTTAIITTTTIIDDNDTLLQTSSPTPSMPNEERV